jgi:PAS domain S-box-containing protein
MTDAEARVEVSFVELLETLPDGVLVTDRTGHIVLVNAQLCVLSGYLRDELVGKPVDTLVPPSRRAKHVALRSSYVSEGATVRAMSSRRDIVLRRSDGTDVPVDVALSPLRMGDTHTVLATVRDASVRRRAEIADEQERALLAAMHDITRGFLAGDELDEALRTITRHARRLLRADFALLSLPSQDGNHLVVKVADGAPGFEGQTVPIEGSVSGAVFRDAVPLLLEDAAHDARVHRPEEMPTEMGPALIVPLVARAQTLGNIAVLNRRSRPLFSAVDVTVLTTFGAAAAMALVDARKQEKLRRLSMLEERERVAWEVADQVVKRMSSVGLTIHTALQRDLPADVDSRLWGAVEELDAAIAALRSVVFPV